MNADPGPRVDDIWRERREAGLCADCSHGLPLVSARGSRFWLCRRSKSDPSYARYPRLPVERCPGCETMGGPR